MTTLGRKIKQLRIAKKLTRPDLADAPGVKTTPGAVYHWETGRTMPDAEKLPFIAKRLDVSVADLFDEEMSQKPPQHSPSELHGSTSQDAIVRSILTQALHLTPTKRRAVIEFLEKSAEVLDGLQGISGNGDEGS